MPGRAVTGGAPGALESFYRELTDAINEQIVPVWSTEITLIEPSSQGGFLWWYQNGNQVFNQGTFDFVSARVSCGAPPRARISASGGFPNAYVQVLDSIRYVLSADDRADVEAAARSSDGGDAILRAYEDAFGELTDRQVADASERLGKSVVAGKLDYVSNYVLGSEWAGPASAPLRFGGRTEAEVEASGGRIPPEGRGLVRAMARFAASAPGPGRLLDEVRNANWMLRQLRANTARPSEANGGIKTVDPNTGSITPGFQVAYNVNATIAELQHHLNDTKHVLRVTVNGPGGDPITLKYPGYVMVPMAPLAWQQATAAGWFYGDPIAQAQRNQGRHVTGFKLVRPCGYDLGSMAQGGDFGLLTHLLVSGTPRVEGAPSAATAQVAGTAAVARAVSSLGIDGPGRRALRHTGNSSTLLQSAYVIGGAFDFPGSPD